MIRDFTSSILPFGPLAVVVVLTIAALIGARRLVRRKGKAGEHFRFREQIISALLPALGWILAILVMPVSETTRGQLLNLTGLGITAIIALSSTTVVANAMAGIMLRVGRSFRMGDFITVKDQIGRVTERGLFHIEIQTENRNLVSIPNLFVISNPIEVVQPSGTFVSATVSLGYDVHHEHVEAILSQAGQDAGLDKTHVQVRELQDHAVEYRVAGFTEDTDHLFSIRSALRCRMLDALHDADVEIVSPSFMYQRPQPDGTRMFPQHKAVPANASIEDQKEIEDLAFDKAAEAESLELLRENLANLKEEVSALNARLGGATDEAEKARIQSLIEAKAQRAERISDLLKRAAGDPRN